MAIKFSLQFWMIACHANWDKGSWRAIKEWVVILGRMCERNVVHKAQTLEKNKYLFSKRKWVILNSTELRFNHGCPQMFILQYISMIYKSDWTLWYYIIKPGGHCPLERTEILTNIDYLAWTVKIIS